MTTIINADCLEAMREMPDNSVDAVICDPPYGLSNTSPDKVTEAIVKWASGDREFTPKTSGGFMGAAWDSFVPPPAVWDECFRVLKPGGHLAAFAGTRTQDLMGISIRLAGFDIRENLAWVYGSGMPKSLNVSKAIDKIDASKERHSRALEFTTWMRSTGMTAKRMADITGLATMCGHYLDYGSQPAVATADIFDMLRPHLPEVPERVEFLVNQRTVESQNFKAREVIGVRRDVATRIYDMGEGKRLPDEINVTKAHTDEAKKWEGWGTATKPAYEPVILARKPLAEKTVAANVVKWGTGAINVDATRIQAKALDELEAPFKYCAKAPKKERPVYTDEDGNTVQHSTVKPLTLLRWLTKLLVPPGGTVLDPFAGSGTTVEAAILEGFNVIGIEREEAYLPLIQQRIDRATDVLPMAS